MPVYEFLCGDCNRVFSFLARTPDAVTRKPKCPKCGGASMRKLFSRFAAASRSSKQTSRSEGGEGAGDGGDDLSPAQEARMERTLMGLAKEMESIDENNPRQLASVMRRLTEATGEPMDPAADEMIRRLEAGEDPDSIEEKMADAFPDEAEGSPYGGGPSYDDGLYDL